VAAEGVPDLLGWNLRVPDLAWAVVLAGAVALAEAVALVGAGVFSEDGVSGAGCSGAAGEAWPAGAGSGIVRTSGTAGPFPLRSMPALVSLAPASLVVPASLVGAPESGASWWAPVSMWTSGAGGSC
jgi:hypothetical protein